MPNEWRRLRVNSRQWMRSEHFAYVYAYSIRSTHVQRLIQYNIRRTSFVRISVLRCLMWSVMSDFCLWTSSSQWFRSFFIHSIDCLSLAAVFALSLPISPIRIAPSMNVSKTHGILRSALTWWHPQSTALVFGLSRSPSFTRTALSIHGRTIASVALRRHLSC